MAFKAVVCFFVGTWFYYQIICFLNTMNSFYVVETNLYFVPIVIACRLIFEYYGTWRARVKLSFILTSHNETILETAMGYL